MIFMGLDDTAPSMRLARAVSNREGRVLLGQGAELTEAYVARLKGFGIRRLWVRDDRLRDIEPLEVFSPKLRARLAGRFQEVTAALAKDPGALKGMLTGGLFEALASEAMEARRTLIPPPEEGAQEDPLTGHSVRVCLLTVSMGTLLMYSPEQLRNLAIGALIHDVGHLLTKGTTASIPWEMDAVCQEHAHLGFESVLHARHLSATISVVCLQHHERMDGQGWPRKLSGSAIHPFARLTAVADRFDTLVFGPEALMPHVVKQRLAEDAGVGLDAEIVKLLLSRTASYPAGTPLRLSSGEQAVVLGAPTGSLDRPLVRVLSTVSDPYDLDLASEPGIEIEAVKWSAPVVDERAPV